MSWLLPGFLGAGLAISLPIILHFLRSKPKAVIRFPTLRFLAPAAISDTTRHRLLRLLTLLLRCLIIALLAAAFARPFFANPHSPAGIAMIVAVDNSMSMQTTGRWETMRTWALGQVTELQPGERAGILLMQPIPHWLVPITDNLPQVRAALSDLKPGYEATHYMPALRVAGDALASIPARNKVVVWMADEQRLGWLGAQFTETLPPGVNILFGETAPPAKSQAAITSVHWARLGPDTAVEIKFRLYTPQSQTRTLTIKSAGKPIATQTVTLTAGSEQSVVVSLKNSPGAVTRGLSVSLDPDDLPADDTAWLSPRSEFTKVILYSPGAGPGSHFIDHALGSLQNLDPDPLVSQPFPAGDWPSGSVAVATADCFAPPLLDHLNQFVSAGGALWVVIDGSEPQSHWLADHGVHVTPRAISDQPEHLRDWDLQHPILAAFAGQSVLPLMEVEFQHGFSLAGDTLTPVANWPDGSAAIAELASPAGRILLTGFPLDRTASNWPVQPTFVPVVHQTLRWLAALQSKKSDWRIGDNIPLQGGEGTWRAIDTARPQRDQTVAGSVRPAIPGLYEFSDGKTRHLYAINTPLTESDLTPWPDPTQLAAFQSKSPAPANQDAQVAAFKLDDESAESQQRLWWWLLAIVAAALLAELAVANRTAM